jgi:hypothetical protein
MDDIWRNAVKKIHKQHVTATQTVKATAATAPTTVPTYANTPTSLNIVMQCNTRLLHMEREWKLTRSGPFPEGIQNVIENLHAALVIWEVEAEEAIVRVWNREIEGEKRKKKRYWGEYLHSTGRRR